MTIIKSDAMSNEQYHEDPAFSSTDVKMVSNKSLAHWAGNVRKESHAFDLGSSVHALLLEPEKDLVIRGPETRRGKAWAELKEEADSTGKILLTESDFDLASDMAESCLKNEMANHLLTNDDLLAEASFFATDPDIDISLKTRPDGLLRNSGIVIDIKNLPRCQPARV